MVFAFLLIGDGWLAGVGVADWPCAPGLHHAVGTENFMTGAVVLSRGVAMSLAFVGAAAARSAKWAM